MQRSIKFRMWDGQAMHIPSGATDNDFYVSADGTIRMLMDSVLDGSFEPAELHSRCVLMQWTGLTDRLGEEIYENDIIDQYGQLFIVVWDIRVARFSLEFIYPEEFIRESLSNLSIPQTHKNIEAYFPCKVVGNIYQNPDLLK